MGLGCVSRISILDSGGEFCAGGRGKRNHVEMALQKKRTGYSFIVKNIISPIPKRRIIPNAGGTYGNVESGVKMFSLCYYLSGAVRTARKKRKTR